MKRILFSFVALLLASAALAQLPKQVTVTVVPGTGGTADTYELLVNSVVVGEVSAGENANAYTIAALGAYSFQVRGVNEFGTGELSDPVALVAAVPGKATVTVVIVQ